MGSSGNEAGRKRERGGVTEGLADPGGPRLSFLCLG